MLLLFLKTHAFWTIVKIHELNDCVYVSVFVPSSPCVSHMFNPGRNRKHVSGFNPSIVHAHYSIGRFPGGKRICLVSIQEIDHCPSADYQNITQEQLPDITSKQTKD